MVDHPGAEMREHRGVEADVLQLQARQYFHNKSNSAR
jgi:hypothetical protein